MVDAGPLNRTISVDQSKISGIIASGLEVRIEEGVFIGLVVNLKDENKKEADGVVASGFIKTFYDWDRWNAEDAYKRIVRQIETGNYKVERTPGSLSLVLFDGSMVELDKDKRDKPYKVDMALK